MFNENFVAVLSVMCAKLLCSYIIITKNQIFEKKKCCSFKYLELNNLRGYILYLNSVRDNFMRRVSEFFVE